jgi:hypothetical protein
MQPSDFDARTHELIGTRQRLLDPHAGYAPEGATVGWSCVMARRLLTHHP